MAQAQKAFNVARTMRSEVRAEERHALRQLGKGNMRVRSLENKVARTRNKLRLAERRMVDLRHELLLMGIIFDDNGVWAYATSENYRRGPFVRAESLTTSGYETPSASSSTSQESYDVGRDAFQEPIAKLNVVQWSQKTLPCEDLETSISELSSMEGMAVERVQRSAALQQVVGR